MKTENRELENQKLGDKKSVNWKRENRANEKMGKWKVQNWENIFDEKGM